MDIFIQFTKRIFQNVFVSTRDQFVDIGNKW